MEGGSDLDRNLTPETRRPWLEVRPPDGAAWLVELAGDVLRIGRETGWTDVDLHAEDGRWISRRHFRIERRDDGWAVVDEGSRNGTFLRRRGTSARVERALKLEAGDTVAILARMQGASPVDWEFVFHDPELTEPAPDDQDRPGLAYDWVEGRAFVVRGRERTEIAGLRPQEHRLLRHLVARNEQAGGAVLCAYEELIVAVWGDEPVEPHTRDDLARLVYDLRRKVEPDPARPQLVETVRGFGYRLASVRSR
jgi:DNA-binding response OmpR family regulator